MARSRLRKWLSQGSAPAGARVGSGWYEKGRRCRLRARLLCSGSVRARHREAAAVQGSCWLGRVRLGEGEDEVSLKEPSPLLFIKV